jgi:hypothetical protein
MVIDEEAAAACPQYNASGISITDVRGENGEVFVFRSSALPLAFPPG